MGTIRLADDDAVHLCRRPVSDRSQAASLKKLFSSIWFVDEGVRGLIGFGFDEIRLDLDGFELTPQK